MMTKNTHTSMKASLFSTSKLVSSSIPLFLYSCVESALPPCGN